MAGAPLTPTPTSPPPTSTHPSPTEEEPSDTIAPTIFPTKTPIDRPNDNFVQVGIPSIPTPCNEVVFQVSTAVIVKYGAYYPSIPIESFRAEYRALPDGSLISPPFDEDLQSAHLSLLIIGCLAAVFLRNIYVSFDYVRRGKVKKKTLFYVLLASQLFGPLSLFPVILSYFIQRVNCTAVVHVSYISAAISLGLLITGILGIKAYKCLENPRILLVFLGLLQVAAFVFVILDTIVTKGARRLTGSCIQAGSLRFTRFFVTIQFFQSLVICLCFVYVCFKSRGSPASRGRISVRLSMDDLPIQMPPVEDDSKPQSRGWWDHVPGGDDSNPINQDEKADNTTPQNEQAGSKRRRQRPYDQPSYEPKDQQATTDLTDVFNVNAVRLRGRNSPALSVGSRFSRMFPRMSLFRKVVKDELFYTTFITSTCVVVAVLAVIGLNFKTSLSVTGWIALNWAVISLLTVHSFGRVVHRHERESWIQQSASSRTVRAASYSAYPNSRRATRTRTPSVVTTKSRNMAKQYGGNPNDPYSDIRPLDQDRRSWQFGTIVPPPPTRSPILLSVRNVTPESNPQEYEFERAPPLQRNVSWQSLSIPNRI
ncbi:hypothetical protein DFP72DRAFT_866216 [Ephemerocybe angulata]|uniref:Uncharacterized protein n=1 Tax=Ephemerocybe angulata TaxID=980116 RepID=A0A8H6ILB7_9AGAR|nr:hypothetical protein DFP72DRAFT_866216 [Tulosesus angulatus]